jgi:BASS family bile acid:Na+ symporter
VRTWKILAEERTLAVLVLAAGIFVGLGVPTVADMLRPWALPALFLVCVFSLMPFAQLPLPTLFSVQPDLLRIVLWQQAVLPCIIVAAGVIARFPDTIIVLTIVTACSGSLFSSPALAELLGLDRQRALQAMVLSTLFMPVSLFIFLSIFQGSQAQLDIVNYGMRTLVFLAAPFALMVAWRPVAASLRREHALRIGHGARWATIFALLIFGTGLMSGVADKLESNPARVLFLLALATALCLLMIVLTTIVMYRFGYTEAMTSAVVAGFRNIGLGFALVGEAAFPDLAVYAGISLLPVFVAPLVIRLALESASASATRERRGEADFQAPY